MNGVVANPAAQIQDAVAGVKDTVDFPPYLLALCAPARSLRPKPGVLLCDLLEGRGHASISAAAACKPFRAAAMRAPSGSASIEFRSSWSAN